MEATKLLRQRPLTLTFLLPLARPHIHCTRLATTIPHRSPPHSQTHTRHLSLPTILQPSFWASMVPKPLRNRGHETSTPTPTPTSTSAQASRTWNPATPFIILSLLVGSQAIQVLWLKQERAQNLRKAEAKIGILKEVIERVQNGEKVDVERLLGTGDAESEKAWAEVLKDLQNEEALFETKKTRQELRQAAEAEAEDAKKAGDEVKEQKARVKVESLDGVKFY
ncbi:hypothetical protein IAQ61_008445 [Plenodomus lingam]|uniref:Uncharacterized protein n=1 Tax=Leptosphaeria maculans (strain JN3 / isolate v23.1.3 / race Av1-4-5-6-7-8) TaxID=985895 RepID=E4ZUC5_LEPMJ|nr:hypothetical protein LEMA_P114190.1 [Plenodomus lingam JN3]KAH9866440.1 hypothetical protein IAQ61_008445 [Plenodomus lingam]CBX95004.1 hypothetical protein LEMA_P114190.1 [Plenodomus lingam JN3]